MPLACAGGATAGGVGPSPRVRGIRRRCRAGAASPGSIPAGAGNPTPCAAVSCPAGVHPRGCGESITRGRGVSPGSGPSPRVRGIPRLAPPLPARLRSIPAGAGNPRATAAGFPPCRVHPRGCGESAPSARASPATNGPSPRVRGIQAAHVAPHAVLGSIPAGAGNPWLGFRAASRLRVHPRGCGESPSRARRALTGPGPSPRVRGIHDRRRRVRVQVGSIPAGAGNPACARPCLRSRRVHPRGCGESLVQLCQAYRQAGPSPRVRGIRGAQPPDRRRRGSIPAGAGNPAQ